jgi:hypothetical protein
MITNELRERCLFPLRPSEYLISHETIPLSEMCDKFLCSLCNTVQTRGYSGDQIAIETERQKDTVKGWGDMLMNQLIISRI